MCCVIGLDGWNVAIDWGRLYRGDSFFVPSINVDYDRKAIEASAQKVNCSISTKLVVENDVQGIRVWVMRGVI